MLLLQLNSLGMLEFAMSFQSFRLLKLFASYSFTSIADKDTFLLVGDSTLAACAVWISGLGGTCRCCCSVGCNGSGGGGGGGGGGNTICCRCSCCCSGGGGGGGRRASGCIGGNMGGCCSCCIGGGGGGGGSCCCCMGMGMGGCRPGDCSAECIVA